MSPLWRDEVGIFIGPGKVVLARMRRGVRPKCVAEQGVSIDNFNVNDWRPALDTLRRQLENELWADANLRVVLSDHWARYAVLPWSPALSRESERIAHARLVLADTYGDLIDSWAIRLSDGPPNSTAVISAISDELLGDLDEIFKLRKLRMLSLQPHLIVSYNAWRKRLPDTAAWFVSIDDGLLAAMHLTNGRCDKVRSVRISDNWSVELKRMQTVGRLARSRVAEGQVYVDAPAWLRTVADTGNAALEWLDDAPVTQNIASKVSLLKGMYS